jgi:translation initiation factor IF-2
VRREVAAELAALAEKLLQEAGHGATRDLLRRVTSTLDALSSYGSLPNAPAAGRLTEDLEPPGFAAVLSVLPAAGKPAASRPPTQLRLPAAQPVAKPTKRAHEEAAAARRAEEERKRAAAAAAAKAAVLAGERALSAACTEAERATQAAADAERALSAARKEAERATRAAADAERALELARRQLAKDSR